MITMDVQTLLAILVVLLAAGYVARRAWRTLRPAVRSSSGDDGGSCGSGCGCGH